MFPIFSTYANRTVKKSQKSSTRNNWVTINYKTGIIWSVIHSYPTLNVCNENERKTSIIYTQVAFSHVLKQDNTFVHSK